MYAVPVSVVKKISCRLSLVQSVSGLTQEHDHYLDPVLTRGFPACNLKVILAVKTYKPYSIAFSFKRHHTQ